MPNAPAMFLATIAVCSSVLAPAPTHAKEVAQSRDGERWLVAKHQSGQEWLVTYDVTRGTVSGSVASEEGAVLIDCNVIGMADDAFDLACFSAIDEGWTFLTQTRVAREFFEWPPDPEMLHPAPELTVEIAGLEWEKKDDAGGLHDRDNVYAFIGVCRPELGQPAGSVPPSPENQCLPTQAEVDEAGGLGGLCPPGSTCELPAGATTTVWDWLAQVNREGGAGYGGHSDWRLPSIEAGDHDHPICDGREPGWVSFCGVPELELLRPADCNQAPCVDPLLDVACVPGCDLTQCSCTAAGFYLSSVVSAERSTLYAHGLLFSPTRSDIPQGTSHVRAVRTPDGQ